MARTSPEAGALDWPVVVDALAAEARTPLGARAAHTLLGDDLDLAAIEAALDALAEVRALEEDGSAVPVGSVRDIEPLATRASKGEVLGLDELRDARDTLEALRRLHELLGERWEDAPRLAGYASAIDVPDLVVDTLLAAFDPTGQLSGRTYPLLGELRSRIVSLGAEVRTTLGGLLERDDLADVLQDRFISQRGDRYVIPVKAHAKRWDIGIVHGTSGSGRTVFIEPHSVVQLNNRLRVAEAELEAEERRIRRELSAQLGAIVTEVAASLVQATAIDLACARESLGRRLEATRPRVGEDGLVDLKQARHPVLLLRDVDVVANDLRVGPALVLTGPNTGGKTIALKTIGLCALLVRCGCEIPAAEGSRIDRFAVVRADIGDQQTVHDDLSSFSGHLASLQAMLDDAGPDRLFLLDEIAVGTDPSQGAALARAVLETLVERGAKLVVTTHYAQLKGLGSVDARFAIAGMEYLDGRPTYRVVPGVAGDSHALATAARLGMDAAIVERARELLGEGERTMLDTLAAMDAERVRLQDEAARAETAAAELEDKADRLARREKRIAERARELEEQASAAFRERLTQAERAIGAVVADLQRGPSHKKARAARETVQALGAILPTPEEPVVEAPAELAVGDRVRLVKLGQVGEVVSISGNNLQVQTRGLTVKAKRTGVERLGGPVRPETPARPMRRVASPEPVLLDAVRTPGNTLDMRGMRAEEAEAAIETFFDRQLLSNREVVFLLHGHGTGVLKQAVRRDWLPGNHYVRAFQPAGSDQGGDAYTVVAIR